MLLIFVLNIENLAAKKSKLGQLLFITGFLILLLFTIFNVLDGIFDFFSIHSKPIDDEYYDHLIHR
jgi:hypothetical protein